MTNFHSGAILQHFVRTRDCKAVPLPLPECVLLDVDVVVPPPPELDEDDVLEEAADTEE